MKIVKVSPLNLQIITKDKEYLTKIREEFTSYVEGFQYMAAWKAGHWDGKTCMVNSLGVFPYGLLFDYIKIHKKNFPDIPLKIGNRAKQLFLNPNKFDIEYLKLSPRPYQKDCIEASLKHTKGIIRSSTASGKSYVITGIVKNLLDNNLIKQAIIVVPGKSLIKQFHGHLVEYGIDETYIGEVYSQKKQWDKKIVVSTWQSLSRNHDKLNQFGCIIIDEVHGAKSFELKKILSKATSAKWRLGFTGTMHSDNLDNWNVKSYLGPIIRDYSSGFLAEEGYISRCNIHILNIEYLQKKWKGTYNDIKDEVFNRHYRMKLIEAIVKRLNHNVLLLVGKVEGEGKVLKAWLKDECGKTVEFLSGKDKVEIREEWRKRCMVENNIALIATYGIMAQGIDIPNLKYVIFVSPFKAKIRILQSVGRSLRKHADKENGAHIFDIADMTKYFKKHGEIRLRYYDAEKFNIIERTFVENVPIDLDELFQNL